jgi:peptide/nickel transport system substrate-binding protein
MAQRLLLVLLLALSGFAAYRYFLGTSASAANNVLRVRLEAPVTGLNPLMPNMGYGRLLSAQIFLSLGAIDPQSLELKPLLVKSIPTPVMVADGPYKGALAYQFEIEETATWDNGSPVTGNDVAFTIKMIMNPLLPMQPWRGHFEFMRGMDIDAANPKRFTVYQSQFYALAIESLCQIPIYPAYHYDPTGGLGKVSLTQLLNPQTADSLGKADQGMIAFSTQFSEPRWGTDTTLVSGSGPYRVVFLDPNQGVTFVKKQNWWGNKMTANPLIAAHPTRIEYKLLKEEDVAINALRAREVDIIPNLSPAKFLELKSDPQLTADYDFIAFNGTSSYNRLMFNLTDPILADKNVRKAIAHAVNYDEILTDLQKGFAVRVVGPIMPLKPYYAKHIVPYPYQIDQAKALLAASGWTDTDGNGIADKVIGGKKTELVFPMLHTSGSAITDLLAASIIGSLAKAGIKVENQALNLPVLSKETQKGNFKLAILASGLHPGTADLHQQFHSENIIPKGDNRASFKNEALDQLIDQLQIEQDQNTRTELYFKAQEILHEELPEVFLYSTQSRFVFSNKYDYAPYSPTAVRPGYLEQLFKLKRAL